MSRNEVDDFGLIYVPDAMSKSVAVLDNNKNEILRIGEYGNMDQMGGPGANPEIPLSYFENLTKVNNSVYIADLGNKRVVKVKLGYAVQWDMTTGIVNADVHPTKAGAVVNVHPSPSHGAAGLQFTLPANQKVSVSVYSPDGRLIKRFGDRLFQEGSHQMQWDGRDGKGQKVNAGMYVAQVKIGKEVHRKNVVIVR